MQSAGDEAFTNTRQRNTITEILMFFEQTYLTNESLSSKVKFLLLTLPFRSFKKMKLKSRSCT